SADSSPRRNRFMPDAVHVGSGKVRELYALDDERLLLVASDRISTFDVVLPTEIPDKGRVLTGLSGFWFARTTSIVPNHLLALREDASSSARSGTQRSSGSASSSTAMPPGTPPSVESSSPTRSSSSVSTPGAPSFWATRR